MAESQSRYGIIEQLNTKKIEAQKRLSAIETELEQQKMEFENNEHQLNNEVSLANSSYESNHSNWIKNQEFNLNQKRMQFKIDQKLAEQTHEREMDAIENLIVDKKETYKEKHEEFCGNKLVEINRNTTQYEKYKKIQALNKESIAKEIKGYDEALSDLKDVSKESVKKE